MLYKILEKKQTRLCIVYNIVMKSEKLIEFAYVDYCLWMKKRQNITVFLLLFWRKIGGFLYKEHKNLE